MQLKDVKNNLGKKVLWRGVEYTLVAYTLRKAIRKKGEILHELELLDPYANNSVCIVDMEEVESKVTSEVAQNESDNLVEKKKMLIDSIKEEIKKG